jgi:dolichyl-phosphate-mannose--protein O-mannosyl transferase
MVGRIYLIGNPFLSWLGLLVVIFAILRAPWTRERKTILFIVFSYLVYFIPWALSPRIMFLYHYLPSIPFMAIILGYHLRKYPKLGAVVIPIVLISFIYFYPHWTGLQIPEWWDKSYYWFSSWR